MTAHQQHRHEHARMTIDMPFEEHKRLKAMAAFMGVTLKDLVLSCLRDHLLSENEPNDETLKAFKETDEGKGLVRCKDFNDFIDKLGLK
jgi:antitoxin component of RelBE/YafQ-DinJ toxin-antitoxin module